MSQGKVSLSCVQRSFTICESRCVDVPFGDHVFGGAALVPFLDLLNHDSTAETLSARLVATPEFQMTRHPSWCDDVSTTKTPFYVVVRAQSPIPAHSELTYAYADPEEDGALYEDPVFWASRFRFLLSVK